MEMDNKIGLGDLPHLKELVLSPKEAEYVKSTRGGRKGITLTWSDLTVYAKQHHKSFIRPTRITYKKILNNVSGAVESGKLVALMGPSGAGKSTILYTLANRHTGSYIVDGDIRLNGQRINNSMCKISGLMRQEDLFINELTVKEHLLFMARLKLDRRHSSEERDRRVSSLIDDLGLSHCTHRKIGGSTFGNVAELSGGERKRLSFATACLPDPPLLFCDEPTSGLDSLNALRLVSMMASWNGTILCTIHQPSPEILKYFSSIILIADGSLVFSGSIKNGIDFFKSVGYELKDYQNVGDFLLNCLSPFPGSESATRLAIKRITHQFALSDYAKMNDLQIHLQRNSVQNHEDKDLLYDHKSPLWIYKYFWLFLRAMLEVLRDPQIQWIRLAQKIVVAITAGLCFVGAVKNDQAGVQAVQGALFIIVTENSFPPMYSELALFSKQLPFHAREIGDGDYHPSTLYFAKILSNIPGLVLEVTLFTWIVYFLADLRRTYYAYFMVLLSNILCAMVSGACGSMFANTFSTYERASTFLIPFDNAIMITSGVFIKLSTLPLITTWFNYLSWMMYNYESMTIIQWEDAGNISCSEIAQLPCLQSKEEVLEYYSFSEDHLHRNLITMTILFVTFHAISYVCFARKVKNYS